MRIQQRSAAVARADGSCDLDSVLILPGNDASAQSEPETLRVANHKDRLAAFQIVDPDYRQGEARFAGLARQPKEEQIETPVTSHDRRSCPGSRVGGHEGALRSCCR